MFLGSLERIFLELFLEGLEEDGRKDILPYPCIDCIFQRFRDC